MAFDLNVGLTIIDDLARAWDDLDNTIRTTITSSDTSAGTETQTIAVAKTDGDTGVVADTPTLPSSSLAARWETDSGVFSTGGILDYWADQIGGVHAFPYDPLSVDVDTIGGQPAITFDGIAFLEVGSGGENLFRNLAGATVYFVLRPAASSGDRCLFEWTTGDGSYVTRATGAINSAGNIEGGDRRLDADSAQQFTRDDGMFQDVDKAFAFVFDWANHTAAVYDESDDDGGSLTTSYQTGGSTSDTASNGKRLFNRSLSAARFVGAVSAVFVYQAAHDSSQRSAVMAFINNKYLGVSFTLGESQSIQELLAKSSSDSGTTQEAGGIGSSVTASDANTSVIEAGTLATTLTHTDTATVADAVTNIKLNHADANTSVVETVSIATAITAPADTAAGVDAVTSIGTNHADTNTSVVEAAGLTLTHADTAVGVDAATSIGLNHADASTLITEAAAPALTHADTGAGVDAQVSVALAHTDVATGVDAGEHIDVVLDTIQKSDSDSATGADTSVSVALSHTETATGADAVTSIGTNHTDANTSVTEAGTLATALTHTDTATAADAVTNIKLNHTDTNTSVVEAGTLANTITSPDTAAGAEAIVNIQLGATDTSTLVTETTAAALAHADTATGTDAVTSIALSAADTATEAETETRTAQFSDSDTAAATEAVVSIALSAADTGTLTEELGNASPLDSPTPASADTSTVVVESESIQATLVSADTATVADTGSVGAPKVDADTNTSIAEAASIAATVQAAEVATGTDTATSVGLTSADTAAETETQYLNVNSTDSGTATETQALTVVQQSTDAATATDINGAIALSATDTATATELVAFQIAASDAAIATDLEGLGAALTATDPAFAAEMGALNAALAAFDTSIVVIETQEKKESYAIKFPIGMVADLMPPAATGLLTGATAGLRAVVGVSLLESCYSTDLIGGPHDRS